MFPSRRGVDRGMTGLERCADGLSSEGRKITATLARSVSEVEGEMVKLKREREAVKSDRTVRSYHVSKSSSRDHFVKFPPRESWHREMKRSRKYFVQYLQTPRSEHVLYIYRYAAREELINVNNTSLSYSTPFICTILFKLHPRPCLTCSSLKLYCLGARPPVGVNSQVPFSKWYLRPLGFK